MKPGDQKDMSRDMKVGELPRIVNGDRKSPYILEVTITRRTDILPAGLVEIHISKSPMVPEKRAEDVIKHALIDVLGPNPPFFTVDLPNGSKVPAYDWFDHAGAFKNLQGNITETIKSKANAAWGRDSLWLVLNRKESSSKKAVLDWFAGKLWHHLIGRHNSLPEG